MKTSHVVRRVGWLPTLIAMTSIACVGDIAGSGLNKEEGEHPRNSEPPVSPSGGSQPGGVEPDDKFSMPDIMACANEPIDVGQSTLRRLSHREYQFTLKWLFGLDSLPEIPELDVGLPRLEHLTTRNVVTREALDAFVTVAGRLFDSVDLNRFVGCDVRSVTCLSSFVESFGARAFRRQLDEGEVSLLIEDAVSATDDHVDRFRFVTEVLLASPSFMYRSPPVEPGLWPIEKRDLVTRVSFALQGKPASPEVLDAAEHDGFDLATFVDEMLDDATTKAFLSGFFSQWLGYRYRTEPTEPPPDWTPSILDAMKEETIRLVDEFAFASPPRSLFGMLTANHSYLTSPLAKFYGAADPTESTGRVEFSDEQARAHAGILGHGSLMMTEVAGDLVARRGAWFLGTFLCTEIPAPEGTLLEAVGDATAGMTHAEIIAERNQNPRCAGCHAAMDPIGIVFEGFDTSGRWNPTYDVRAYGVAPGFPDSANPAATTPAQIGAALAKAPELPACIVERMFETVHGRAPTRADKCTVARVRERFADSGFVFRELVAALLTDPSFQLRRVAQNP